MFPPCEMMVKNFLPAVRGLLIYSLRNSGYSQSSIAKFLGVTQSAVSQSLSKSEQHYVNSLIGMGVRREEVETLVSLLMEDIVKSPERANETLYSFWNSLLSEGRFCDFHRNLYPQLANCEICLTPVTKHMHDLKKMEILRMLEEAVFRIEKSSFFRYIMPQVSINIVYSIENPASIHDVAGIPGRIVRVDDRVKAVAKPIFGASQHMANVLLAINMYNRKVRAAMNVRNDDKVKQVIQRLNIPHTIAESSGGRLTEDDVIREAAYAYRTLNTTPAVVFHEGGIGYEPATYIFGEDPIQVTLIAESIARLYVELG